MREGEHPDVALLREALEGNRRARSRLVDRVGPLIEARIHRRVSKNKPIGINGFDDVAQQVWLRLFDRNGHRLQGFDPDRGTLEGYISRIAESEILDLLKRPRLSVADLPSEDELSDPTPGADVRTELKQLAEQMRVHLDTVLPTRGKLILRLLHDDGRDADEVAEIMEVSKQVVANWKHKIKKLAEDFQKKFG